MNMKFEKKGWILAGVAVAAIYGCGSGGDGGRTSEISIDGSSTVSPIMEAVAEEFGNVNKDVRLTVATSGTGGGFKKFANGEIDMANASRAIEDREIQAAKANTIDFVELPIAFDGLSIVVNPQNDFVDTLTVAELKKIWEPNSKVKTWADVRSGFPNEPIKLYGPGTDSGTFDYFTKAIVGEEKASRSDYQASEDDNTLVQGVSGDRYALGYFGYAYYDLNKENLKLVKVDNGSGPVAPTPESIADGTYAPLSRPLFLYVNSKALGEKPAVMEFLRFLLTESKEVIESTGYIPLPDSAYQAALERVEQKKTGTVFKGAEIGVKIEDILSR